MIALYQDPQGKRIFDNMVVHSTDATDRVTLQTEKSRIIALEKEINSLQAQLKQQQSVSNEILESSTLISCSVTKGYFNLCINKAPLVGIPYYF